MRSIGGNSGFSVLPKDTLTWDSRARDRTTNLAGDRSTTEPQPRDVVEYHDSDILLAINKQISKVYSVLDFCFQYSAKIKQIAV